MTEQPENRERAATEPRALWRSPVEVIRVAVSHSGTLGLVVRQMADRLGLVDRQVLLLNRQWPPLQPRERIEEPLLGGRPLWREYGSANGPMYGLQGTRYSPAKDLLHG